MQVQASELVTWLLSPEERLIWLSLRPEWSADSLRLVREAVASCREDDIARAAYEQAVSGVVRGALQAAGIPALDMPLHDQARAAGARTLAVEKDVRDVVACLDSGGIPHLLLKGAALAAEVWQPAWWREYEDLDVMVRREDAEAVDSALGALGYARRRKRSRGLAAAEERADGGRSYVSPSRLDLDLHWSISKSVFPLDLDTRGWWRRARRIDVAGTSARSLGPEDLLLYLSIHGCKDLWRRRVWVGDIARVLRRYPLVDGSWVVREAARSGTLRMLGLALALAAVLLDGPLPHPDLDRLALSRDARRWMLRLLTDPALQPMAPASSFRRQRFGYLLRDRTRDRLRGLLGDVFTPRSTDCDWAPLPGWAFPLYGVLRPVRLLSKNVRDRREPGAAR